MRAAITGAVCALVAMASCAQLRPAEPSGSAAAGVVGGGTPGDAVRPQRPLQMGTIFSPLDLPAPTDVRTAAGEPGPGYWQNRCDYVIAAMLDPAAERLSATARVTYHNESPHTLEYLWLTLEQNLFRPGSDGATLTAPGARFGNRDMFDGGYDISAARSGGRELELAVYDTLGRLELPAPLGPGGAVTFEIDYAFNIPPYGADRMGIEYVRAGKVFEFAQWYPAVCKFDDVRGWNTLPYLGQGEFYTDFGDYRVSITAPREFIVVGGGLHTNPDQTLSPVVRQRVREALGSDETVTIIGPDEVGDPEMILDGEGPLTWEFASSNARTFAFAASDAFIWDAASIQPSTVEGPAGQLDHHVLCQSLYPEEAREWWTDATQMLRDSIVHYSRRWRPYPYPIASNISGRCGGMEYPMIIYCRGRGSEQGLFGVTTHEIGHNWFPMLVNTDERRYPWMDEGFNTFINYYHRRERYPDSTPRRGTAEGAIEDMLAANQQPMMTEPDRLYRGRLGFLMYEKPAVGLVLLREQILGPERFDPAFRAYISAWSFKSPQPADFFRMMEQGAGMDLAWFWRGWMYSTGTLDQAVTSVRYDSESGQTLVRFENLGELVMPLVYEVQYTDGSAERFRLPVEAWHASDEWTARIDTGGRGVAMVIVDPDGVFPDVRRANNAWRGGAEEEVAEPVGK
ncbi:MAG: M1 family metallopeptidase [Phycisphaerales bacterium JB039]